jgi:hypothetical protein
MLVQVGKKISTARGSFCPKSQDRIPEFHNSIFSPYGTSMRIDDKIITAKLLRHKFGHNLASA